jgi:5-methylcytosine-specific restriction enzyme A
VEHVQLEHGLEPGLILTGADIQRIFSCSGQGTVRTCGAAATLIVSDQLDGFQPDVWAGPVVRVALTHMADAEAPSETWWPGDPSAQIFLLERVADDLYVFDGPATPAGAPCREIRQDADGAPREIPVLPLRLVDQDGPPPLPVALFERMQEEGERRARHMSRVELERRAAPAEAAPAPRLVLAPAYPRNPFVAEFARRRAGGHCMLCGKTAPFRAQGGRPFLEVHHVEWLSRGGPDTPENAVALCPDCHRRAHVLDLQDDRDRLALALEKPPEPKSPEQQGPRVASDAEVEEFYEALMAEAQAQSLPPRPPSTGRLEFEP